MLVLLSGVSGAGKDTIKRELIKRNKKVSEANLKVSDTFLFIWFFDFVSICDLLLQTE